MKSAPALTKDLTFKVTQHITRVNHEHKHYVLNREDGRPSYCPNLTASPSQIWCMTMTRPCGKSHKFLNISPTPSRDFFFAIAISPCLQFRTNLLDQLSKTSNNPSGSCNEPSTNSPECDAVVGFAFSHVPQIIDLIHLFRGQHLVMVLARVGHILQEDPREPLHHHATHAIHVGFVNLLHQRNLGAYFQFQIPRSTDCQKNHARRHWEDPPCCHVPHNIHERP